MTTRRRALGFGLAGGLSLLATPALAHRLARSETDVRIADDGEVRVTHVLHLQDAQDALYKAGLIDRPDLGSLRARAKLALYTEKRFALLVNGDPAPLKLIGAEIEGDSVFVYQQGRIGDGALLVRNGVLRDLMARQVNSVNVVRGGKTVTLEFRRDDGVKLVPTD